ncbi:MAG: hypothetical protein H3C31_05765 [Brumimicrobium sp.]|nr:hypothetical protein [Brumimicrobium sp.]MCO5267389.1 hypothetical protein [Brumimicrobium sp.]
MKAKTVLFFCLVSVLLLSTTACNKNKDTVIKVFVHNSQNNIEPDAFVKVVGDKDKGTAEFYKEEKTNSSGFALINVSEVFKDMKKGDDNVAYFYIYASDASKVFTSKPIRVRAFITNSETITLNK